jgi:hypothetical protein
VTNPQSNPADRLEFDITFTYEDDWDADFTSVFKVNLDFLTSVYNTDVPIYWEMVPIDNEVMPYRSITTVYSGTADLNPMDYPEGKWIVPGQPWPYDKFTVNFSRLTGFGEMLVRTDKWHLTLATYDINCWFSEAVHQLASSTQPASLNDANISSGFAFAASNLDRIASQAALLYRVRDEVLNAEGGQYYIDLYYANSAEIADILNAHSELAVQGLDVIDALTPGLEALPDGQGDTVTITDLQVQQSQAFLDSLLPYASPELQQAIASERARRPLENIIGMTMEQAQTYLFDIVAPTVVSNIRASTNPTAAAAVDFTVTFAESVTGVDVTDFALTTTGVTGAAVSGVTGSGATYTVTVNTGTGNGTIRLDLIDNDSILDATSHPLGGVGADNGNFNTGQVYTVDKVPPSVVSITRVNPNPTSLPNVDFTVTFSEAVTGVDVSDFTLSVTGVTGASVSGVSGSGSVYTVTVYTGSSDGTIRLDGIDNDSILDATSNPLGGVGAGNGNFTTGQVYTVDKGITLNLKSIGVNDGWVLESTETSGVGGSLNSTAATFTLGDDAANKQYRAILHFDTSSLPDWVIVTSATIKIQQQGQAGSNPFNALGSLAVDIRKPYFSSSVSLTNNDFQAAASQASVGTFNETPTGAWYSVVLNAAGISNINLTGTTQFRLRFTTDDNNDLGADYFTFSSGDAGAANRPQLIIEYFIPIDSPIP